MPLPAPVTMAILLCAPICLSSSIVSAKAACYRIAPVISRGVGNRSGPQTVECAPKEEDRDANRKDSGSGAGRAADCNRAGGGGLAQGRRHSEAGGEP